MTCMKQEFCIHEKYCQRHIGHNFDSCILFSRNSKPKRKATNKDWLNSMSAEDFADWLTDTFDLCGAGCSNCFVKELCFNEHINKMPSDLIVEWLKQPKE